LTKEKADAAEAANAPTSGNPFATVLDLDDYVPYLGATQDVDLGGQGITTEWVKLNTTPVIPTDQGSMYWDEDDNVLAVVLNGAIQKVGEVTFYNVKNQTGSTIAKGTGVGFAGVVGASARIKVAPYLADGSQPSIYYVGITAEDILDGEDGKVYNFGPIRGLNTSAFSEGDVLYASSTVAGGFTTTPPTAPNNVIVVAAVLTDSATVGALLVRITVADLGGGGRDDDAVHYDAADSKNATEKRQARTNIGSVNSIPQVINLTADTIYDPVTKTSNLIVFTGSFKATLRGVDNGIDGEGLNILNLTNQPIDVVDNNGVVGNRFFIGGSGKQIQPSFYMNFTYYNITGAVGWRTNEQRKFFGITTFTNISGSNILRIDNLNSGHIGFQNQLNGVDTFTINGQGTVIGNSIMTINGRCTLGNGAPGNGGVEVRNNNSGLSPFQVKSVNGSLLAEFINSSTDTAGHLRLLNRSGQFNDSVRRDELPFNYPETVTTSGTINDLSLSNEGVKLLILTLADDLTGVVPVTTNTGRLLRIEGRNATGVIIRHDSASSTAANRFSIGSDLTIANGEIYTFIYTNARWRRVL
jgi:hypothetical protein